MRIFICMLIFTAVADAQTPAVSVPEAKMTTKEAKAKCKAEGKKGKDLLFCIKNRIKGS
jgi:hypothetical protein